MSIGATADAVRHHCVLGAGIPGVEGTGGLEMAGNLISDRRYGWLQADMKLKATTSD